MKNRNFFIVILIGAIIWTIIFTFAALNELAVEAWNHMDIYIAPYPDPGLIEIFGFQFWYQFEGVGDYAVYYMHWVGNRVINDIRRDLLEKIIYFPLSFFKKKTTGELMSHFLNDITMVQQASSSAVKNGVRSFAG